jgi:hypothetical protein
VTNWLLLILAGVFKRVHVGFTRTDFVLNELLLLLTVMCAGGNAFLFIAMQRRIKRCAPMAGRTQTRRRYIVNVRQFSNQALRTSGPSDVQLPLKSNQQHDDGTGSVGLSAGVGGPMGARRPQPLPAIVIPEDCVFT